jgi:hypothetical protein
MVILLTCVRDLENAASRIAAKQSEEIKRV